MKSLLPQDQEVGVASSDQLADFWASWRKTAFWALVAALVIDFVYFFGITGSGLPAKPGWVPWLAANLVFAGCMAAVAVNIWRHYGGTPPLFKRYAPGNPRNAVNGLVLGLLLFGIVLGVTFVLLYACSGGIVAGAGSVLRDVLFAETGDAAYVGLKVIGVSMATELAGKVEEQPPR